MTEPLTHTVVGMFAAGKYPSYQQENNKKQSLTEEAHSAKPK